MQFEIVEYQKDDSCNDKVVSTYTIDQIDLSRTIDQLEDDVRHGRISKFDVFKV